MNFPISSCWYVSWVVLSSWQSSNAELLFGEKWLLTAFYVFVAQQLASIVDGSLGRRVIMHSWVLMMSSVGSGVSCRYKLDFSPQKKQKPLTNRHCRWFLREYFKDLDEKKSGMFRALTWKIVCILVPIPITISFKGGLFGLGRGICSTHTWNTPRLWIKVKSNFESLLFHIHIYFSNKTVLNQELRK